MTVISGLSLAIRKDLEGLPDRLLEISNGITELQIGQ